MFKQPKRYKSYHEKTTQEASDALTLLKNKNFTTLATIIGITATLLSWFFHHIREPSHALG